MRQPRFAITLVVGLAALVAPALAARASVVAPSLATLVARADRIVVSEVVEVRCERDGRRDDDVPVTLVTVRVIRTLKGAGGSQVVLELLGGSVADETLEIFDIPRFAVGDRDVLFLSGRPLGASPIVGVFRGRFRLLQPASGQAEAVAAHDGRFLTEADLASAAAGRAVSSTRQVSLPTFESAVLTLVAAQRSGERATAGTGAATGGTPETAPGPRATKTTADTGATWTGAREASTVGTSATQTSAIDTSAQLPDVPLLVEVNLGPAPALVDGCPDWSCALESKAWFRRLTARADGGSAADGPAPRVVLEWASSVFGRAIETDTAALSIVQTKNGAATARVVFNPHLEWNSYGSNAAPSPGPLDLAAVAAEELSLVAAALAVPSGASTGSPGSTAGADVRSAARSRRAPLSRDAASADSIEAAATACGAADVFVDPRLLVFDSPDHALMTAYQVGFFQPGAASPAQVVDVPLTAFLTRLVVDMPAWAVAAMQTSLVADIRSAGLATPVGLVYTYRVRGVWAGGTTGWSDSSQPFVRCAAASTTTR